MLRSSLLVVTAIFCPLAVFTELGAAEPSAADIKQIEELEQWLNTILDGKLKNAALAKVWTGAWDKFSGPKSKPVPRCTYGILLSDTDETFQILDLDSVQKRSFVKSENAEQPHRRVAYELATLAQAKKEVLANNEAAFFPGFGGARPVSPASRTLIACLTYRAGEPEEAVKLIREILGVRRNDQPPATIKQLIVDDISGKWMRSGLRSFADTKISRQELVQPLRQLIMLFPTSKYAERVKATVAILDKMIQEDEAHCKQLAARKQSGVQPSKEQRIADLIFHLRDQNGDQSCIISDQNGRDWFSNMYVARCDIFLDPRGKESPAHQLADLGDDSVPQLIEALDDARFTRSLDGPDTVLRVGDCAATIISHIAGRRFDHLSPSGGAMVKDGQARRTKAVIEKWWDEYVQKGRKQMLIEGTARGDKDSLYQFDRLVAEYPKAMLQPMISGAAKTERTDVYSTYIRQLGSMNDDRSLEFLNSESEKPSRLRFRAMLAVQLMIRGEEDVVPRMLAEWEQLVTMPKGVKRLFGDDGFGDDSSAGSAESMVEFFMATEDPAAVNGIAEHIGELAVEDRLSLLRSMLDILRKSIDDEIAIPKKFRYKKGESQEFNAALEQFFHQTLKDTERHSGLQMSLSGYRFKDPRICDFAAYALARCWPSKYKYPRTPSDEEREAIRQSLLQEWEKNMGRVP